jgi:hypothetical protein
MYLAYFDENKHSEENPHFYIGGILISDDKISDLEKILSRIAYNFFGTSILTKDTEIHGVDLYQGKAAFKGRKLEDRIALLKDLTDFVVDHKIPIRIVNIDVQAHREKYYYAEPEYRLGLMLILERFCDFLEKKGSIGLAFGDYEQDEVPNSILDFSQFKSAGRTNHWGRPLGPLKDTIYFTHSHHSRFLQLADVVIYLANRYEQGPTNSEKWHELELRQCWEKIQAGTDIKIQRWP